VPDHPDREELAAWQAGVLDEPDQGRTAAHVAGCPDCGAVVGALDRVRQQLAVLEEPELPAGLHDRLAAALEPERAHLAHRARRQRPAWYQRPATWSAAAAVLLFVAGAFGLARLGTGGAGDSGGATAAQAPAQPEASTQAQGERADSENAPQAGGLATIRLSGEFSQAKLQAAVSRDTAAQKALKAARSLRAFDTTGREGQLGTRMSGGAAATAALPPADPACADQITAAGKVRPAFVADSTANGRRIKVLVGYVGDPPRELHYWAFPEAGCTGAPLFSGVLGPAS